MEYKWLDIALRAMEIGFDDDQQVDYSKTPGQLEQAKNLLIESIKLKPDKSWPYIKLADLVDEEKEKIIIYKESLKAEPTDYVKARLFELYYNKNDNE